MIKTIREQAWFIFGVGIFFLLLQQIGLKETYSALKSVRVVYLLLAFGLIIVGQQFIPFIKWMVMCRKTQMGLKIEGILTLSSSILAGGIITPGRSGEFLAAFFIKEAKGKISSMVFFNRVIESSITLAIAFIIFGIFFRDFLTPKSWTFIGGTLGLILFFLYVFGTRERFGLYLFSKGKKFLFIFKKFKLFQKILNLEDKIAREVEHFYLSLKSLFSWKTATILAFFTCVTWMVMMLANKALFQSVGSEIPFFIIIGVMVLSAIGSFISPTPGGIGLGDIPPVYFLYVNGYYENVGAFILLGRIAVYAAAFGWYLGANGIYRKRKMMLKKKNFL